MSKQIDEMLQVAHRNMCHVNCTPNYTNLLLFALRPVLNQQVKTGYRSPSPGLVRRARTPARCQTGTRTADGGGRRRTEAAQPGEEEERRRGLAVAVPRTATQPSPAPARTQPWASPLASPGAGRGRRTRGGGKAGAGWKDTGRGEGIGGGESRAVDGAASAAVEI